jgi:hypothetical protein
MFRRARYLRCAATGVAQETKASAGEPVAKPTKLSPEVVRTMQVTYRRLRMMGESDIMLRRAVTVHSPEKVGKLALALLQRHRRVMDLDEVRANLKWYRFLKRTIVGVQYRYANLRLGALRIYLRSTAALSNFLLMAFFLGAANCVYQMWLIWKVYRREVRENYAELAEPIRVALEQLEAQGKIQKA